MDEVKQTMHFYSGLIAVFLFFGALELIDYLKEVYHGKSKTD